MDPELVGRVLEDWKSAGLTPRLRVALEFLEKVTLRPAEVVAADARKLLNEDIPTHGVRELLYVCFLFNVLDRLADALDFDPPSKKGTRRIGWLAHRLGYGIAKLPG